MGAKVKLTDIIDEMEMQTEEDSPLLKKILERSFIS